MPRLTPYAITLLTSLISGYTASALLLKRNRVPGNIILYSLLLNIVTTLYGSKMYGVILSGFKKNLFNSGIASIGAVVGFITAVFIMTLICRQYTRELWESYILPIPLLYSISKIGCHISGCCHGISYSGPFSVSYSTEITTGGPFFPVQISETIVFACIFIISLIIYLKHPRTYLIPGVLIICGLSKSLLELMREEHVGKILSANQIVCIIIIIISLFSILKKREA